MRPSAHAHVQATIFCVMECSGVGVPFGVPVSGPGELEPTYAAVTFAIPPGHGGRGSGADLTDCAVCPLPLSPTVAALVTGQLLQALAAVHSVGLIHRVSGDSVQASAARREPACVGALPVGAPCRRCSSSHVARRRM
jgi:hypothetical protein